MKAFNYKGMVHTIENGIWRDSGGLVVSNWWQDRLNKHYRSCI